MRIALVTYALHVGGIEISLRLLADYFREMGHDVDLIETHERGRWSRKFSDDHYSVIPVLPSLSRSRLHHAMRVASILREYNLILLNDAPYAQSILGLLPHPAVCIAVLHSSLTTMVRNAVLNARNSDALSAVSPAVARSAADYGAPKEKVFCIPNGIDIPDCWPKRDHDFSRTPFRIVYLGAINHVQKGTFYLEAIAEKLSQSGILFHLSIIGDGPDLPELKKKLRRFLGSTVDFLGMLSNEQAKGVLSGADVLLMPSHFEGLPIVLLEAISLGVVPVASHLPGCTDFVIKDGIDGRLIAVGDERAFADALYRLATNRSLLETMSEKAWEKAKRFSIKDTGNAYLELYENCLDKRLAGRVPPRSGKIERALLGDLPMLPIFLLRPVRKLLRMAGLFPQPAEESLLFVPENT